MSQKFTDEFVGVKNGWAICYKKAIGSGGLLFPERLSAEFLEKARKTMGSYLFANQYQNEVIPPDEQSFKAEWFKYYESLPKNLYRFAFVDPAIGQKDHHDYTGIVIVAVDDDGIWYVEVANRYRLTPTQLVSKLFELHQHIGLKVIGIETVAYQEALLYFLSEEMRKRQTTIPVTGVKRDKTSKQTRILGLVPRFEWGRIYLAKAMTALEDELTTFPRGTHDDLLDALASIENIVFYPDKKEPTIERPNSPTDPRYESWYIQQLGKGRRPQGGNELGDG